MKKIISKIVKGYCKLTGLPKPEGRLGLFLEGHRSSVGGKWDEIGKLQFDFMLKQGLAPHHILLDIGCGSLRGGIHFIKYLKEGNYLGIDKNESWVNAGVRKELGKHIFEEKKPQFVFSDKFEFNKFSKVPDYAIAQSLFTHLTKEDIKFCLKQLHKIVNPRCLFLATFSECNVEQKNYHRSYSHKCFQYTQNQMSTFGENNGWKARYIGDWNHPRGQKMMEYTAV